MPTPNLTHFVLVDFENVPGVDLSLLGKEPLCVTLFLGPKSKLKPGLVEQITTQPFEVRLIKVGQIKKNALDFVLAYHLGEMVTRFPRGHYYLISGDQDFAPLVTHLRDKHVHISQHNDIASLPFLARPQPLLAPVAKTSAPPKPPAVTKPVPVVLNKKPVPDRRAKIIARLKDPANPNRATTLKGLHAYIKNALGKEAATAKVEEIISELRKARVLTTDAKGKVAYL